MSSSDKLIYLNGTKEAIKQAIIDKGVEVSSEDTFRSYATKIGEISGGGGGGDSLGYKRVSGVPNGEDIITNAPDIESGGVLYKPIYYICLLDTNNTRTFSKVGGEEDITGGDAFIFSDEPTTLYVGTTTHTFDITKDFITEEGWKCRYVIVYATATNKADSNGLSININKYTECFEFIGASGTILGYGAVLFSTGNSSNANRYIKYIDISRCSFKDDTISGMSFIRYCQGLIEVVLPTSLKTITGHVCLIYNYALEKINLENIETISGSDFLSNSYLLGKVNFENLTALNCAGFLGNNYKIRYMDLENVSLSGQWNQYTLGLVPFIKLPVNFDIDGANFAGAISYGYKNVKSNEWLNNELPTKLKDNSSGDAKAIILEAHNIALMTAETLATIAAKNWTIS